MLKTPLHTVGLLIDFSNALDSIPVDGLLEMVHNTNPPLPNYIICWLVAYLHGRSATCLYNGSDHLPGMSRWGSPNAPLFHLSFSTSTYQTIPRQLTSYFPMLIISLLTSVDLGKDPVAAGFFLFTQPSFFYLPSLLSHHRRNKQPQGKRIEVEWRVRSFYEGISRWLLWKDIIAKVERISNVY